MTSDFQSIKNEYTETFCFHYSPSTIKGLKYVLNDLEPFMPEDMKNLNISHIRDWRNSMCARGLQPGTINKSLKIGQKFFKHCLYKGYLSKVPIMRGLISREPMRLLEIVKDEELWRAVEASESNQMHHAIMHLLYECGPRHEDLTGLQRSDLDYENKSLCFKYDGFSRRMFKLSTPCFLALSNYLGSRKDREKQMFLSKRGLSLRADSIALIIKKYTLQPNQRNLCLIHFRLAVLLRLYKTGMSIERVAYSMGYKNLNSVFHILRINPLQIQQISPSTCHQLYR